MIAHNIKGTNDFDVELN